MAKSARLLTLTLLAGTLLSGCVSIVDHITVEKPLHQTLNKIKTELSIFQRDFDAADFKTSCGGIPQPLPINITNVKVSVSVANGNTVSGGIGATYDRESEKENKFELNLKPDEIPASTSNAERVPKGIADALFAISDQLSKVDPSEPCLLAGEATYTTSFKLEKSAGAEYEFDILVFSADASAAKTSDFNNSIEVKFNFGDTPTK